MAIEVMPGAIDSERYVLGAMLQDPDAVELATRTLSLEDFHEPVHQQIYRVMVEMIASRERFDTPTMARALEERGLLESIGGLTTLLDLIDVAYATANVDYHIQQVREASVRRHLIATAHEILHLAADPTSPVQDLLDRTETSVFNLGQRSVVGEGFISMGELVSRVRLEVDEALARQNKLRGLDTGYADLNSYLAGLQEGDLIILAARPSVGKTAFALNLVRNVSVGVGAASAVFSLEMSAVQLALRLLCQQAQVNLHDTMRGAISSTERERLEIAFGELGRAPIYIDDESPLTVTQMVARTRRLVSRLKSQGKTLGMVVVDYLQLMRSAEAKEQRRLEVAEFSRGLKRLARQLSVPVVACSQLSRAAEKEKQKGKASRRPQLADLYESDAIGQDADVVLFLHPVEPPSEDGQQHESRLEQTPVIEVVIGKHRNGPTGVVPLMFRKSVGRFDLPAPDYLDTRQALMNLGKETEEPPFL